MLDQITPVILTYDEEANIGRTLGQLTWAREVVLVDSLSTDATRAVAARFPNVRIHERTFDDHASQWAFGQGQVRTPWFLALDADYFLPDELIRQLETLAPPANIRGYRCGFHYAVNGARLRASLYPARVVLASTAHATFWQDGHTQRLSVDGEVSDLQSKIIHDDRKPFSRFVDRQRKYMREEAIKLRNANPHSLSMSGRVRKLIVVAPFAVVVHALLVKGLILDGLPGLRYAWERFVAELILSRELLSPSKRD